jgi:hypothetical protein
MSRKKKPHDPLVLNRLSVEELEDVCHVLNGVDGPELQLALRQLVVTWQESGPNLINMMFADGPLWRDMRESLKVQWVPTDTGRAHLVFSPAISEDKKEKGRDGKYRKTPEGVALELFYGLTLNPEWDRLCGPCAHCAGYYVKKTVRQTKYCTRQCGSAATATASTRKRLDEEHADKLRRADAAARSWPAARARLNWKQWVSRREPDITSKWLTRAVNRGQLRSPEKATQLSRRRAARC